MELVQHDVKRFIGIDGGGTKTTCVIGNENGQILGIAHGKSSNIRSRSLDQVKQALLDVILDVMDQTESSFDQIGVIFLALAGSDRPEARKRIVGALRPSIPDSIPVRIDNDAMGALASGTWGGPGTVIIAGTGSIAYSRLPEGRITRVGGWGYLFGDEGSGYDVGRKGLSAVFQEFDGRGERTLLTQLFLREFRLSETAELISVIYSKEDVRGEMAGLSKLVFFAAEQGDSMASGIVDQAVHELISLVQAARKDREIKESPLVLCGGLFMNDLFKNKFVERTKEQIGELQVVHPAVSPAVGAFALAMTSSGIRIDEDMKIMMENSFLECERRG
ncbi:MAG TPA: ROK family protein [Bacillales bacterium]